MADHDCDRGWKFVGEKWAEHLAEGDPVKLAALRNTVYPCQVCRPTAFYRWASKHWDPEHDPSSCVDCTTALAGPRAGKRVAARVAGNETTEQTRRDLQ